MPTRLIHESCRTSKNLQRVADFSERLFWRLLTTADDFGRCLAASSIVRAHCFPLIESLPLKKITAALLDLEKHHLLTRYVVGEREYAQFHTFEQYQGKPRARRSKYPALTSLSAGTCGQMLDTCGQMQVDLNTSASAAKTKTDTKTDLSSLNSLSVLSESDSEFEQVWNQYPRKKDKQAARKRWEALEGKRPPLATILLAIDRQKQSVQWTKDGGDFIPYLSTWLSKARWEDELDPLPAKPIPKSMVDLL